MTHSSFGEQRLGEGAYRRRRSVQNGRFETMNMAEMHMHPRGHQVVMRVLRLRELLCEVARIVMRSIWPPSLRDDVNPHSAPTR